MTQIEMNIITRGYVPGGAKREIAKLLRDCYQRLGPKVPQKVELFIAQKASIMRDFLKEEKFKLGINITDGEESICHQDTWQGYTRITISLEQLSKFTKHVNDFTE